MEDEHKLCLNQRLTYAQSAIKLVRGLKTVGDPPVPAPVWGPKLEEVWTRCPVASAAAGVYRLLFHQTSDPVNLQQLFPQVSGRNVWLPDVVLA